MKQSPREPSRDRSPLQLPGAPVSEASGRGVDGLGVEPYRINLEKDSRDSFDFPQEQGPSLQELVKIFKKRAKVIIAIFLVMFCSALFYCVVTPKLFKTTTILEIRGYAPVLQQAEVENLLGRDTRRAAYETTTTAKIKQFVIADLSLAKDNLAGELKEYFQDRQEYFPDTSDEPGKEPGGNHADKRFQYRIDFLNKYLNLIDVDPIHETSLVTLSVQMSNPPLAQKIANQHAEVFIEHLRDERQGELRENLKALEQHSAELKERLAQAERNVSDYAKQNQLVVLSNSKDESLVAKNIGDISQLLSQATAKRIKSESAFKEFENAGVDVELSVDDRSTRDLRAKLQEAQTEYRVLSQKVTPLYPGMIDLQARIDGLQKALKSERISKIGTLRAEYRGDLEAEKRLASEVERIRRNANDISEKLVNYNLLVREADSLRELSNSVTKELKQTQISVESSRSNIFVSDPAPLPTQPASPRVRIIMILATLLGLIAGTGTALLLEVFDNTIETSEDAQTALRLPSLGYVPSFFISRVESHSAAKKLLSYFSREKGSDENTPAGAESALTVESLNLESSEPYHLGGTKEHGDKASAPLKGALVTLASPHAAVSEALRTIQAGILFSSAERPPKVVMITSPNKGEGKTTVATNLAVTLAQASHRTLLIDADLRNPSAAYYFGIGRSTAGLTHYLTGHCEIRDIVQKSPVTGLHIIGAGVACPNPAELIGSVKMADLLEVLAEHYDLIILDTAPILPVADSLMLARKVDGVVMVVRSGETQRPAAREASSRMRRVRANLLGVVVNDVSSSVPDYKVSDYTMVFPEASHWEAGNGVGDIFASDAHRQSAVGE